MKRKLKKVLSGVLALAFLLALLPGAALADEIPEEILPEPYAQEPQYGTTPRPIEGQGIKTRGADVIDPTAQSISDEILQNFLAMPPENPP